MPYNPWGKRPPANPERTREFTLKSGEKLLLTLRKLGIAEQTQVYELAEQLIERYRTGDAEYQETHKKSGTPPVPFPPIGGVDVNVSETMIRAAAFLYVMQEGPKEDIIPVESWIAFQVVEDPDDWRAIQAFAAEVSRLDKPSSEEEPNVPLASGAATKAS